MNVLLSLLTSGSIKWLSILIILSVLVGGLYSKHLQIVDLEKKTALQDYNIKQFQESIKAKDAHLNQLESISKNKDEIISSLNKQAEELNNKLRAIESEIDVEVGKGNDRPSSDILKNTIKGLSQ